MTGHPMYHRGNGQFRSLCNLFRDHLPKRP